MPLNINLFALGIETCLDTFMNNHIHHVFQKQVLSYLDVSVAVFKLFFVRKIICLKHEGLQRLSKYFKGKLDVLKKIK